MIYDLPNWVRFYERMAQVFSHILRHLLIQLVWLIGNHYYVHVPLKINAMLLRRHKLVFTTTNDRVTAMQWLSIHGAKSWSNVMTMWKVSSVRWSPLTWKNWRRYVSVCRVLSIEETTCMPWPQYKWNHRQNPSMKRKLWVSSKRSKDHISFSKSIRCQSLQFSMRRHFVWHLQIFRALCRVVSSFAFKISRTWPSTPHID